ncbi:fibropellin-1-like, partial [Strongylocentrotus purpuratus]|uniref:EGF-like domain-containing protein n=1 Tax=Strongylocentrotus purpuratus TaxID=7668 RepID=A0A7M7SXC1_STRPU
MACLRRIMGVTRLDRIRNTHIRTHPERGRNHHRQVGSCRGPPITITISRCDPGETIRITKVACVRQYPCASPSPSLESQCGNSGETTVPYAAYCETRNPCTITGSCDESSTCQGRYAYFYADYTCACVVDSDCEYGGTCDLTTLMCMCATGYTGTTCGTGACAADSDCEYGGTCDVTTLMCMCATGYTGTTCETGACAADSDCDYGGTCDVTTLMCMCATGYTGTTCEAGACAVDSDCEYGGTCDLTTLMCMCATGYTGTTCGTGACAADSDCEYGGTCDVTTLMCMCATGTLVQPVKQ